MCVLFLDSSTATNFDYEFTINIAAKLQARKQQFRRLQDETYRQKVSFKRKANQPIKIGRAGRDIQAKRGSSSSLTM